MLYDSPHHLGVGAIEQIETTRRFGGSVHRERFVLADTQGFACLDYLLKVCGRSFELRYQLCDFFRCDFASPGLGRLAVPF